MIRYKLYIYSVPVKHSVVYSFAQTQWHLSLQPIRSLKIDVTEAVKVHLDGGWYLSQILTESSTPGRRELYTIPAPLIKSDIVYCA